MNQYVWENSRMHEKHGFEIKLIKVKNYLSKGRNNKKFFKKIA